VNDQTVVSVGGEVWARIAGSTFNAATDLTVALDRAA